uniref:Salicyl alcohol oxidase n=1 Tax=Chrysomela tremula TaxID=63687 RepID=B4F334_CHRTR|nr:salicyl alcohol oxidase precursor [Chrysomela tremula]
MKELVISFSVILLLHVPGSLGLYDEFTGDISRFLINFSTRETALFTEYPTGVIVDNATYDFVIVGSGPSGSVLANRLSENPEWNILLLEAGEEPSWVTDIPVACGALEYSDYNWGYTCEPQSGFCRDCMDGILQYPHGRVLGGSSIINYMIYTRGNRLDFDRWAAMGNPGWSFDDILPYFLKLESAHLAIKDDGYHNNDGPLSISDASYRSKLVDVYVKASQEAGLPYVDNNGKNQIGVSYVQTTTKNGKRSDAENAYLRPIRNRNNIKIQKASRATKILIDSCSKTAYGVEYVNDGKTYRALATKEVISSAGSFNSPQLLMLSGIGPKTHLEQLGIPVQSDLPVGKKMYDHALFPGLVFQLNDSIPINLVEEIVNPLTYIQYSEGKGFLTSSNTVEAISYVKTNISTDPDDSYPDIELVMYGISPAADHGVLIRRNYNIDQNTYDKVFKPLESKYTYQVSPMLLHPKSLGRIELRSSNPLHPPKFFANYFTDPENEDIETLIAGIREIQKINRTPTMQKYNATLVRTPLPGCEDIEFDSDAYWECAIRSIISSLYHQTATCKMGPKNDTEAVVDHKLKVHGIKGLRVIDVSVIPVPMTAHTVAVAYMVGERASDIIKNDYGI